MHLSRSSHCLRSSRSGGFTLVELLVIVAILVIIAGLLLPVLGKAKRQAQMTVCVSNLKQWVMAAELYAQDNNDELPREKAAKSGPSWDASVDNTWPIVSASVNEDVWYNALPQIMEQRTVSQYASDTASQEAFFRKNVFTCPIARFDHSVGRPMFSLAMNSKLIQANVLPKKTCASSPVNTVLFAEAGVPGENNIKVFPTQPDYDGRPHIHAERISGRHDGSGSIGFFDGHVSTFPATAIVTTNGKAFFPQVPVIWTLDPSQDPNVKN